MPNADAFTAFSAQAAGSTAMSGSLAGISVLVTGGTRGIGRGLVAAFAAARRRA